MVQSMTGYGSSSLTSANYKATVELKSLNSKFVEINIKLPRTYMQQEIVIRNLLNQKLQRGKINAVLNLEVLNPEKLKLRVNKPLLHAYVRELDGLRHELGLSQPLDMEYLLGLPDAISTDADDVDPEEMDLVMKAFGEALNQIVESRNREGLALEQDMRTCAEKIAQSLENILPMLPERLENIKARIGNALADLKERTQVDVNRFEQELIFYIEKLDVNEEVVRLTKHLEYFHQTLSEVESNGKKLGFILQEIGREINTIGSKANHAGIQVHVVQMKEELEKIKEQVQNIV